MPRGDSWSGKWEGCQYLRLQLLARHWVRVDYNFVLYRIHVSIIVRCRCDCCCLSSKDGTVTWESFGQLAASRLTILEMAVDDRCCPHSLVNLRSVSVDFVMWSLSIAILSEFGLSLFFCGHTFAHPFNEAVSLRIVFMCSWRKGWCLQGADRFYVNLCRGHGFLYFETNGSCRGSGHSSPSIWPRKDLLWSGQTHVVHDVLGCQCRHEFSDSNSWTTSTDVPP